MLTGSMVGDPEEPDDDGEAGRSSRLKNKRDSRVHPSMGIRPDSQVPMHDDGSGGENMRFLAPTFAMTKNGTIYGLDWEEITTGDDEIEELYQKLQDGSATDGDLMSLKTLTWDLKVPNLADPRVKILRDELRERGLRG